MKAGDKYQGLLRNFKFNECELWRSIRDAEFNTYKASLANNQIQSQGTPAASTANCEFYTLKFFYYFSMN